MGCCISKFRRHSIFQQSDIVQDKLVISQNVPKTPKISPISSSNKISPSSLSPTTSSVSSFFSTNTHSINSSSSSSSSSSILSSKDRSFSNEFLWSCVKENPHIIRINSIKQASDQLLVPRNVVLPKPNSKQSAPEIKQSIPPRLNSSPTLHKRLRSSPNRQKSFREELDRVDSFYFSRGLKSPSPSRRFSNADYCRKISAKRVASSTKLNQGNESVMSSPRQENLNSSRHHHHLPSCLSKVNRETCIHRINSRIDEAAVQEAIADPDIDSVPLEDIHNPLISLDCFIFL